jgi:hypothetical protein
LNNSYTPPGDICKPVIKESDHTTDRVMGLPETYIPEPVYLSKSPSNTNKSRETTQHNNKK